MATGMPATDGIHDDAGRLHEKSEALEYHPYATQGTDKEMVRFSRNFA